MAVMAFSLVFSPVAALAADDYAGRIVRDMEGHGESWYVIPDKGTRVYLGRPHEAVERMEQHAVLVPFADIEAIAEAGSASAVNAEAAAKYAGKVLMPSDVVGASWYVDPAAQLRYRLATSDDAWRVMLLGTPVRSFVLTSIPVEQAEDWTVEAKVADVSDAATLKLADGKAVRILNVETPINPELQTAAMSKLREKLADGSVLMERDVIDSGKDGTPLRHVFAGASNLGYELVRDGLAFPSIMAPNYRYAEMMIVGQLDAARLKRGFWLNESTRPPAAQSSAE